ncbi:hypothetical protein BDR05DRAFT_959711 [Suillus weaverae]|nr:hypothetical protein BDR05DRAFT_959711 [Suillus weaverae]
MIPCHWSYIDHGCQIRQAVPSQARLTELRMLNDVDEDFDLHTLTSSPVCRDSDTLESLVLRFPRAQQQILDSHRSRLDILIQTPRLVKTHYRN